MKRCILLLITLAAGKLAMTQYKPAENGSSVQFTIRNFGISTGGSFRGLQGDIIFDINDLAKASLSVSIDANTVNTGNDTRDNHLRQDSYFDVKNYPRISFVSTKVSTSDKTGVLLIFGKLTIKNQTKDISFPFTATPNGNGYLFKGTFNINRKDFGVGGTSTISNNLEVQLAVLSTK
ncbi:MAG TPA: YceI family protein [Puia sp.]|jgi:polyisoprenoid-binding protein YceI|nr:YceI family protein [Puia sp.]